MVNPVLAFPGSPEILVNVLRITASEFGDGNLQGIE